MSEQLSLFGEQATEEQIEVKAKKKTAVPQSDIIEHKATKYGIGQFKGVDVRDVQTIILRSRTDIDGTKYGLHLESAGEHPKGILGGYWGLGGDGFDFRDIVSIQNYFDELMESKKDSLKQMYREFTEEELEITYNHNHAYYGFRHIPADNFFIVISDKLLTMMEESGFDFDGWYSKYKSLYENEATLKAWDLALEQLKLIEEGDDVEKEIDLVKEIIKAFNETGKEEFFSMTLDEMNEKLKELGEDLYNLSQKINEINEYHHGQPVNSMEFGMTLDRLKITTDYGKVKL
jgi:hypothetical protein